MNEKEIEEREAIAFYTGAQIGIEWARPKWSERRKLELFNTLAASQLRPVRVLVADVRTIPAIVSWVRSTMTAMDQHLSEVQTLEKMLKATDEKETRS